MSQKRRESILKKSALSLLYTPMHEVTPKVVAMAVFGNELV